MKSSWVYLFITHIEAGILQTKSSQALHRLLRYYYSKTFPLSSVQHLYAFCEIKAHCKVIFESIILIRLRIYASLTLDVSNYQPPLAVRYQHANESFDQMTDYHKLIFHMPMLLRKIDISGQQWSQWTHQLVIYIALPIPSKPIMYYRCPSWVYSVIRSSDWKC